jgi:mannose-6-phosphate isomerase-like protein (cupin superfamily)
MIRHKLSESGERGWFVGAFDRAVWRTDDFEVGYMFNPQGDISPAHYHREVRELSLIASGRVLANGEEFGPGDIFEILPGESLHCEYLEDTITVCVKTPSRPQDKYYV